MNKVKNVLTNSYLVSLVVALVLFAFLRRIAGR